MSHLDTFDPKPSQPAEIRGQFRAIQTSVPGTLVTEHLPRLSRQAHLYNIVRSVHYEGALFNHGPGCYRMLTGRPTGKGVVKDTPRPTDQPFLGPVAVNVRPTASNIPGCVTIPGVLSADGDEATHGQFAGWLGPKHDPFIVNGDPSQRDFRVPELIQSELFA